MNFELLPTEKHTIYVSGVPCLATLVQVQEPGRVAQAGKNLPAQFLEKSAAMAWVQMRKAAEVDHLDLWIYSAWRSHEHQTYLWNQWESGRRKLRPAKPGWSLHESGKAVDIIRSHDDPDGFGPLVGATDKWLEAHAEEFGFYCNVKGEPWHYSHIG